MLNLMIIGLAIMGMIWNVDPVARPYIDVAIWALTASLVFTLGVRLDGWLRRLAARPHWRRARRPRERQSHHSGTSMPLLDK
jgi:hypothetical protein